MTPAEAEAAVRGWLEATGAVGLVLPDGWFGRPYDNQHRVTRIEARGPRVVLALDDRLVLTFTGGLACAPDGSELSVAASQVVFDWIEHGSDTPRADVYVDGTVRLVAL
jgi:hypothetical protein